MRAPTPDRSRAMNAEPLPATPAPPRPRGAPLEMAPDDFRRAGHALVDAIAAFLASLPERPVTADETPAEVRALIGGDRPLPETGADADALLQSAARLLF